MSHINATYEGELSTVVTVLVLGVVYQAELASDGHVLVLGGGGAVVGQGRWSGARIEDCAADLPAEAYDALDRELLAAEVARRGASS